MAKCNSFGRFEHFNIPLHRSQEGCLYKCVLQQGTTIPIRDQHPLFEVIFRNYEGIIYVPTLKRSSVVKTHFQIGRLKGENETPFNRKDTVRNAFGHFLNRTKITPKIQ
jgi:hypothetical protein